MKIKMSIIPAVIISIAMLLSNMTVFAASATSVAFSKTTAQKLRVGYKVTRTAKTVPNGASVKYTSSDPKTAAVNANGKVVGIKPGTAVITASSGSVSATYKVQVVPQVIFAKTSELTLKAGQTNTRSATAKPAGYTISYKSSDSAVATVNASGKVTALKAGKAVITASTKDGGSASYKLTVTSKAGQSTGDIGSNSNVADDDSTDDTTDYEEISGSDLGREVIRLVNAERKIAGLNTLKTDSSLTKMAQRRASEVSSLFSHDRPDGTQWLTVFDEFKTTVRARGENIAKGYTTAEDVMNGWMNSSGHRANILRENVEYIGIGVYEDSDGSLSWVQLFAN